MKDLLTKVAEWFFSDFRNFVILFLIITNVAFLVTLNYVSQKLNYANEVIKECGESCEDFFDTVAEGDNYVNYSEF